MIKKLIVAFVVSILILGSVLPAHAQEPIVFTDEMSVDEVLATGYRVPPLFTHVSNNKTWTFATSNSGDSIIITAPNNGTQTLNLPDERVVGFSAFGNEVKLFTQKGFTQVGKLDGTSNTFSLQRSADFDLFILGHVYLKNADGHNDLSKVCLFTIKHSEIALGYVPDVLFINPGSAQPGRDPSCDAVSPLFGQYSEFRFALDRALWNEKFPPVAQAPDGRWCEALIQGASGQILVDQCYYVYGFFLTYNQQWLYQGVPLTGDSPLVISESDGIFFVYVK